MKKVLLTVASIFSFGFIFSQQNMPKTDFMKTTEEAKVSVYKNNK